MESKEEAREREEESYKTTMGGSPLRKLRYLISPNPNPNNIVA
jgi:hypothetical protein